MNVMRVCGFETSCLSCRASVFGAPSAGTAIAEAAHQGIVIYERSPYGSAGSGSIGRLNHLTPGYGSPHA